MDYTRRSFTAFVRPVFWLLTSLYFFLSPGNWNYIWIINLALASAALISIILRPRYFQITDSSLIINRSFFRRDVIEIQNIEKIELQDGPFSPSQIRLKGNQAPVVFDYYSIRDSDLKKMVDHLEIDME